MPVPTDITAGTISISGSTVTGVGTSFVASDIRQGDLFIWIEGGAGQWSPIVQTVTSNTVLTLAEPWTGPTISGARYRLRYQWDSSRVSAQSRQLIEMLDNGNVLALAGLTGPGVPVFDGPHSMTIRPEADFINGVAYNVQVDTLTDRAAYDGQAAGFSVLVSDVGDGRSAVYSKASNASGDWTDPAYVTGPVGPLPGVEATVATSAPGSTATVDKVPITGGVRLDFTLPAAEGFYNAGIYDSGAAYTKDQVVRLNGSSFIALQAVPAGTSPSSAFPPVDTAFWQVLAAKGADGLGTGDVVGPSGAVDGHIVVFDGPTGKLTEDGGVFVSDLVIRSPQGRLTLTAATPAPESDVTGATSIYYTPSNGNRVPVFDGSAIQIKSIGNGLTLPLNANTGHAGYHAANTNFDLFAVNDAGTLRLGTGPSWNSGAVAGSNVVRGTGAGSTELEQFDGLIVNKNSMTLRFGSASGDTLVVPARRATYLGSFRATANGQASDSKAARLLFNAYNVLQRGLKIVDPAVSWTYNTAAFRQANGNVNMKAQILLGLAGVLVSAEYSLVVNNTTSNSYAVLAIGIDSNNTPSVDSYGGTTFLGVPTRDVGTKYLGFPGLGFHEIVPLENSGAVGTTTFYSAGSGYRVGLFGSFLG